VILSISTKKSIWEKRELTDREKLLSGGGDKHIKMTKVIGYSEKRIKS
jgi:hypothetical protein